MGELLYLTQRQRRTQEEHVEWVAGGGMCGKIKSSVRSQSLPFSNLSSIYLVLMLGRGDNKNSAREDAREDRPDVSTRCYWSSDYVQQSEKGDFLY